MSTTVVCFPQLNDQFLYSIDHHHHQQQQQLFENSNQTEIVTTDSCSSILSKHSNEDEVCQICGDLASGWHCGAITCEACKKFFLRSLSTGDAKRKYKCQKDYACLITKRSRTQCQYCRFEKCLAVGMKPHEPNESRTGDLYKKLPCLICGGSASGIHFGAVTCEACKGFFRRSIKENAPEKYHCSENNNCPIVPTAKITCRACRFAKCIQAGMSMDASRIGRQSNLFKESIRQLQSSSTSMASATDSARITSMAKRRKTRAKSGRVFASTTEIDFELSSKTKDYIKKIHHAYVIHLKALPECIRRDTIWWTMVSQMIVYAEAIMNFCRKIIPDFDNLTEKYEIISSSIHSVVMICLLSKRMSTNYWNADMNLSIELNTQFPQLMEIENIFRTFDVQLQSFALDEKELALLIFMIITRTNLNLINEDNQFWSRCQYESVQAFSEYTQARRTNFNGDLPLDFYDFVFTVSQIRILNRRISKCLMNIPWPYIGDLPTFLYQIYFPTVTNKSPTFWNPPSSQSSWYTSDGMNNPYSYSPIAKFDYRSNDDITVSIRW